MATIEIKKLLKRYKKLDKDNKSEIDVVIQMLNSNIEYRLRIQAKQRQKVRV